MAGVVLENISTKKLVVISVFLLSLSLAFFLMGGLLVPQAVHTQVTLGTWCHLNSSRDWHASRPSSDACRIISQGRDDPVLLEDHIEAKDIVFSFQYPLPRGGDELAMSRSFMYHVAVLSFRIEHNKANDYNGLTDGALLGLNVLVGYRDKDTDPWTTLLNDTLERTLHCADPHELGEGYHVDCEMVDLFEIGHMHYRKYLVNIMMPPNEDTGHNTNIGELSDVELVWFAQTGGFTYYYLILKSVCFAMVLPLTIWNWRRVITLNRSPVLLEQMLMALACATIIMNFPVDWFVFVVKMPFMLLWSDIRQGMFLAIIFSYWLIFVGEHMLDDVKRGHWTSYWRHLVSVALASSLMLLFDLCERGMRIADPFFSLWSTAQGTTLGKAFIGISITAGAIYVIILQVFVVKTLYNVWKKRGLFPSMAKNLRIHYKSLIYRFFFMLIFTSVCGLLTVTAFAIGQVYESRWKWDFDAHDLDDDENNEDGDYSPIMKQFEISSAFQLGVYGLWNVYVMSMLIFYAPSHKLSAQNGIEGSEADETVELTAVSSSSSHLRHTEGDEGTDETTTLTSQGQNSKGEVFSHIQKLSGKMAIS